MDNLILLDKLLVVIGNLESGKSIIYNNEQIFIGELFVELKQTMDKIKNGQST